MSGQYPDLNLKSNFYHALRHLSWQCTNIGSLTATSAFFFESANHHLIKKFIGNNIVCSVLVKLFFPDIVLHETELADDYNKTLIANFLQQPFLMRRYDYAMAQTEAVNNTNTKFLDAELFCRDIKNRNLDSLVYRRRGSFSYVTLFDGTALVWGNSWFSSLSTDKNVPTLECIGLKWNDHCLTVEIVNRLDLKLK